MRRVIFVVAVVALVLALSGVAFAADLPIFTESGVTNPVAWGLVSWQTTRFYVRTPTDGTWVKIQVFNYKGVVKTIYDGALPSVAGRWYSPAWGGTDTSGHHLPMGNYKYRITLSKGGVGVFEEGPIAVSKSRWTITGDGRRYVYAGTMFVYITATSPVVLTATQDRAYFQIWRDGFPAGGLVYNSDRFPVGNGFPFVSEGSLPLYNSTTRWRSWRTATNSGLGTCTLLVLQ